MWFLVLAAFLILLLIAGLTTALIGGRARKIDDHPLCKRCGFDLVGMQELRRKLCPECGRVVVHDADVKRGHRARSWPKLWAGLAMIALALGIAVPLAVPLISTTTSRPTWTLLLECEYGTRVGRVSAAIDELIARDRAGRLSQSQRMSLAQLARDAHRSPGPVWGTHWAKVLNDPAFFALLPQAEQSAALREGLAPTVEPRARVRAGGSASVPVRVTLPGDIRILQARERAYSVRSITWTIRDSQGKTAGEGTVTPTLGPLLPLYDSAHAWAGTGFTAKAALAPGAYTIDVSLESAVFPRPADWNQRSEAAKAAPPMITTHTASFEVLPEDQSPVTVRQNPAALDRLRRAISVEAPMPPRSLKNAEHADRPLQQLTLAIKLRRPVNGSLNQPQSTDRLRSMWTPRLFTLKGREVKLRPNADQIMLPWNNSADLHAYLLLHEEIAPGRYRLRLQQTPESAEHSYEDEAILDGFIETEFEVKGPNPPSP